MPNYPFIPASIHRVARLFTAGWGLPRSISIVLLILSWTASSGYACISAYIARQLVYARQVVPDKTPAELGLQFHNITFTSRDDNILLQGWFIPGILPNGTLTTNRTIIVVHGLRTNREDKGVGILDLCAAFARHGFAVLAFDMRGAGASTPAPLSLGYFEQRDVLGAVDFLRSGPLPYPNLSRPRIIGGWGVSMGGATLLLAASQEPDIRAIVADSAYADVIPLLEREIPKGSHLPPLFTPGILTAAWALYGANFYNVRPVEVVAKIAPRPIFFIHGSSDDYIPPSNMGKLVKAAHTAASAHIETWLVPGAEHAQAFHTMGAEYVSRVVTFFTEALGPDTKAA